MNADPIKPLLGDYLDRELSPAEQRRVESHLGECSGCRAALDELKSLSNMIGGLPRTALPAGFLARLERRRDSTERRPPTGARAAAFAAASLLAVFVIHDRLRVLLPISRTVDLPAAKGKRALSPGRPVDDPAPAAASEATITNERLQRELERQKRLLGVRVVSPERHPMGQFAGTNAEALSAPSPTPALGGRVAELLAPALPAAEGVVVHSESERTRLWAARHMALAAPSVDYSQKLLVVVIPSIGSQVAIDGVIVSLDRTVVRYRQFPRPAERSGTTCQFRSIPRTDSPVVFERVP